MPRPRKFLQQNSDYRYFVEVYPPDGSKSRRLYLGTKDRPRADKIGEVIRQPWEAGDDAEVELRLDCVKDCIDDPIKWAQFLYECRDADDPTGEFLETYYPDIVADFDRWNDPDRPELEKMDDALGNLLDEGRTDLIEDIFQEVITANPKGFSTLRRLIVKENEPKKKSKEPAPSSETLSTCLQVWVKRSENKGLRPDHITQYQKIFNQFIELVTDLPVSLIKKKHLLEWVEHNESARKDRGARWYNEQMVAISGIFKVAMQRMACDFPEGLRGWMEFAKEPYAPRSHNRQPMPVTMFHKLIEQAEKWGALDIDEYAATLRVSSKNPALAKCNNRKQAKRIKRAGLLWSAILRLSANVGADNVDICRLTFKHQRLDGELPLFMLPRKKVEHKVGQPIERLTPLLADTVAAIKRWMDYQRPTTDYVFTNDAKRQFVSEKISAGFARLREAAGQNGFDYKSLRNIGPSIGKRNRRHPDEREAFLGHVVRGTSRFYEGDVDETYLVDLVNLIGAEYFGGKKKKCKSSAVCNVRVG